MRCDCLHRCPRKINPVAIRETRLVTTGGGRTKELNNSMVSIIASGIDRTYSKTSDLTLEGPSGLSLRGSRGG